MPTTAYRSPKGSVFRRILVSVLSLSLFLVAVSSSAQKAYYLAMKGEGSAAVLLDDHSHIAYITDGGGYGRRGIGGAIIDDQSVLKYLLNSGVHRLVIVCSHPHADHMGGLVYIIQNDHDILKFRSIVFIDNDYERLKNARSLYSLYRERWGTSQDVPPATYSSAHARNSFSGIAPASATVKPRNYVYTPRGSKIHDQSIISEYKIAGRRTTIYLVDFDDASNSLIEGWSRQKPTPQVNVLVFPHHGSSYSKLSPILSQRHRFKLRDVIIAVNEHNRYYHPSPEVLLSLIKEFGPLHVFVTGSIPGRNVMITSSGAQWPGGEKAHIAHLNRFIYEQIHYANQRGYWSAREPWKSRMSSLYKALHLVQEAGGEPFTEVKPNESDYSTHGLSSLYDRAPHHILTELQAQRSSTLLDMLEPHPDLPPSASKIYGQVEIPGQPGVIYDRPYWTEQAQVDSIHDFHLKPGSLPEIEPIPSSPRMFDLLREHLFRIKGLGLFLATLALRLGLRRGQ